jgi:hypothetical protein
MWKNRVDKKLANGIHGTLFYDADWDKNMKKKKQYYSTKKWEEAVVEFNGKKCKDNFFSLRIQAEE